jgi:hypothetical protein
MTALAYWNLMASNGMAKKSCTPAPEVGLQRTAVSGWPVLELDVVDTDRERIL